MKKLPSINLKVFFFLFFFILGNTTFVLASGAPDYLPDGLHPRIWLTSDKLIDLKQKMRLNSAEWQALINWNDQHLNDTGYDSGKNVNWKGYRGSGYLTYLANYALAYQVLKDDNPVKADIYANYAMQILNSMPINFAAGDDEDGIIMIRTGEATDLTLNAEEAAILGSRPGHYKNGYAARNFGVALPLAYDWLYDKLTLNQKNKLINVMYRMVDWYRGKRTIYNNGILHGTIRYHEDHDGVCDVNNICTQADPPQTLGWGATSITDNFFSGYFIMSTLVGISTYGDNPDALGYLEHARTDLFANQIKPSLMDPLLNKGGDSVEGWNYGSGWWRHIQSLWALQTSTGKDYFTGFTWPKEVLNSYMHTTASNLTDIASYGHWTGSYDGKPYEIIAKPIVGILRHAYGNQDVVKRGQYYLKNATFAIKDDLYNNMIWYDPNAPILDFTNEPDSYRAIGNGLVTMRSSWINSSDTIFASIRLEGKNFGNHELYDEGTLLIQRGADKLFAKQPMLSESVAHNTIVFNNTNHYAFNPPLTKTAINRYENNPKYLFVRGDITNAWKRPWKVDRAALFNRNLIFLKPNYFIIYDTTRSNTAQGNLKDWYTQYIADPVVNQTANTISATVGNSKVFTKTLQPAGTFTKTIPASGYWRVKFTPSILQEYDQFLHVIEATDSASPNMVTTDKVISIEGNMIGAHIKDAVSPKVVLFSSDQNNNDVIGNVTYTVNNSVQSQHILLGLQANTKYSVKIDGTLTDFPNGVISSNNATLMFEYEGTGLHTYAISVSGIVDSYPSPPIDLQVTGTTAPKLATLTWTASTDDGTGDNDVVNYNIYRSSTKTGIYTLIDTISNGIVTYSDTSPLNGYNYYKVTSVDSTQQESSLNYLNGIGALFGPAVTTPTVGFYINKNNYLSFSISGTAKALATVQIFIGSSSLGTTTADQSGNWSINIDFSSTSTSEGSISITVQSAGITSNIVTGTYGITSPVAPPAPRGFMIRKR